MRQSEAGNGGGGSSGGGGGKNLDFDEYVKAAEFTLLKAYVTFIVFDIFFAVFREGKHKLICLLFGVWTPEFAFFQRHLCVKNLFEEIYMRLCSDIPEWDPQESPINIIATQCAVPIIHNLIAMLCEPDQLNILIK